MAIWISYEAHADARDELYDECSVPVGTRDSIISGIHIMPWATSSHKAATCIPPSRYPHRRRNEPYKGNPLLAMYTSYCHLYIRIPLVCIMDFALTNKNESLVVSELYVNKNGENLKAQDDIFSPFLLSKKTN